ncbi:MAG TPA: hypothetical protein EYH54_05025 [Nautiliaceae bacterium]|nr:hypothetical protein [Nautiliaceae bacterium]
MIKLINIKDFEKVLELIENEIELTEKLKEDLNLNSVFYLDKLDKFDLKEAIIQLNHIDLFFEKEKIELKE